MSYSGYALNCDLIISKRFNTGPEYIKSLEKLKDNDKIFIDPTDLTFDLNYDDIITILKNNNIKLNFYIAYEPIIDYSIISKLLEYSYNIYIQNNIYINPKIHILPIGIRDCETSLKDHAGFNHKYLLEEKNNNRNKDILCLLCFTINTNSKRINCANILGNTDYILNLYKYFYFERSTICGRVPVVVNYEYTSRAVYVLSPDGYGIDTHRFFEAIYLNSIPIVVKQNNNFDKLYNFFPCLIIEKWEDITKEFLILKIPECIDKLKIFHEKYPNFLLEIDENILNNL